MKATVADYDKYISSALGDDVFTITRKAVVAMFYNYLTDNNGSTRKKLGQARCCAALLSGIINLIRHYSDYEWIYKSEIGLAEYCILTHEEVIGAKAILVDMKILQTDRSGKNNTNRYKIDFDVLLRFLNNAGPMNVWEEKTNTVKAGNPVKPGSNDETNPVKPGLNNNIIKEVPIDNKDKPKPTTPALRDNTNFSKKQNPKELAMEKVVEARQSGDWSTMTGEDFAYYYAAQHEAILGRTLVNRKGNPMPLFRGEFITRLNIPIHQVCDVIDAVLRAYKDDIKVQGQWKNLLTYNALFRSVVDDKVHKVLADLNPVISKYTTGNGASNQPPTETGSEFTPEQEAELIAAGATRVVGEDGKVTFYI
jgi:hypothetical protein